METIPPQSRMVALVRAWALEAPQRVYPVVKVLLPGLPARGGAAGAE